MAPDPLTRFRPPPLESDELTRWTLHRAFGPPEVPTTAPPAGESALEHAGALGVAERIGHRIPESVLARELLDSGTAHAFRLRRRRALEVSLAYDALADRVAEHAAAVGTPLILLKGYALHAGGLAEPGSRRMGDLDVLASRAYARALYEALKEDGFQPAPGERNEQHLPPLAAPGWGVVDVHDAMRGVADEDGAWLDAEAVLSIGGAIGTENGCWIPDRHLLAAHVLAHGIEQHASNPRPYPLFRMIGDLLDLLPDEAAWEEARASLEARLGETLEPREIAAARDLALGLSQETRLEELPPDARLLLAHLLAHALDAAYRESLHGRHRRHRLRQAASRGTLLRYAKRKLLDLWRRLSAGP